MHENAVTVAAALLLIVVLGTLIAARFGSLYSIRNIANINPLITTDNAELIAVDMNGVPQKGGYTDNANADGSTTKGGTDGHDSSGSGKSSTGDKSESTSNTGGTGSSSGSGTSTSSGTSPSNSPSPSPTVAPTSFTASVQSLEQTGITTVYDRTFVRNGPIYTLTGCKNDRTFQASIKINSGSGSIKVQWFLNDSLYGTTDVGFVSSGNIKTSDMTVTTNAKTGNYSITAKIINTGNSTVMGLSEPKNFSQNCIV